MNQPDLGKKIAELRKAKGFTQEALVEKCNLSVRTLQRIESGEVIPRSYTLKTIFSALEYSDSLETDKSGFSISNWIEQPYRYVFDLFDFKTNKMKKITILSIIFSAIVLGLFGLCTESNAQKREKAIKVIEDLQNKSNKWINNAQIDSVLTLYRADAQVLPTCSNLTEIREMMQSAIDGGYKLVDFKILSISIGDSIAVQKYYDVFEYQGITYQQKGLTEWRSTNGRWLIVNDIMVNY